MMLMVAVDGLSTEKLHEAAPFVSLVVVPSTVAVEPRKLIADVVCVAFCSASALNYRLVRGWQRQRSDGATVYPVNPNRDEVDGERCYRSVLDVPEDVDVAGGIRRSRSRRARRQSQSGGRRGLRSWQSIRSKSGPSVVRGPAGAVSPIVIARGTGTGFGPSGVNASMFMLISDGPTGCAPSRRSGWEAAPM